MLRNIEIKVRCRDLSAVRERAVAARAEDRGTLLQTDTFYHSAAGRLKLREIAGDHAELIWYARDDVAGSKRSDYVVSLIADPLTLHAALEQSNGTRGVVRKRRDLFLWRNVRIHLDAVQGLGDFVELESVVGEVHEATASANLDELLGLLGLTGSQVVAVAYADLLQL